MDKAQKAAAMVLFSGGQDSATVLPWALDRFDHVETVGFDYGQRHDVELQARHEVLKALKQAFPAWAKKLGTDHVLALPTLANISQTALTRDMEISLSNDGLPNTFVPGRNLLFFTYAAALGYRLGITTFIGGMCETDYSGYPDCRNETLQSLAQSLSLGMAQDVSIKTPLMWRTKAQTFELAEKLGGEALVKIILEHSHTCYHGARDIRHPWGYGCGTCPACKLRAKGFEVWQDGHTIP